MEESEINPWFNFYVKEFSNSLSLQFKKFDNYFLCPCCYFPTLKRRVEFEICALCRWEDDGQDDHNADTILGGPNSSYSLTEARNNFIHYLTMYRPFDTKPFERTTIKKTFDGKVINNITVTKRQIIEKYNFIAETEEPSEREKMFKEIFILQKKL